MSWCSGFEDICQTDTSLAEHTWYRLGGPARWLFTPRDEQELAGLLRRCAEHGVPWRVLGCGANVLVRDRGFEGAVIKLSQPAWQTVRFDDPFVHAAAGADFPRLVHDTLERGLVGLENLGGIPGTVGGAVRMNAGGRHGYVADYLRQVRLMSPDGQVQTRSADQLSFGYRTSRLNGCVVVAATFELKPGDRAAALDRYRRIWAERSASQPAFGSRSAGCIFKNPPGQAAGKLIDEAGLKGERRGGAEISRQHANFIVAHPGATAQAVLDLIALARERVRSQTGIDLELEVEIW
jgi:UDP-N-acetylmuramate dehydrogenase